MLEVFVILGLISLDTWKRVGGTTDYAVDIYHKAITDGKFTSFLSENSNYP